MSYRDDRCGMGSKTGTRDHGRPISVGARRGCTPGWLRSVCGFEIKTFLSPKSTGPNEHP